ncbi:MAG: trypsin-like peptidase domain-containing protein [Dehalococcoidia bacterium]|nr:trypsin-like peptidase domain-containing protein [Dehalococcoidia bacterium]
MRTAPLALGAIAAFGLMLGTACSDSDAGRQPDPGANSPTQQALNTATATGGGGSTATATVSLPTGTMSTADLVKKAGPAVVRISTGGSVGSGFIVDASGYIVTNNHVVSGSTSRGLNVTLADGSAYVGTVVGTDPRSDLALVKIDADQELAVLPLADLDKVNIGDDVVAIGYALDLSRGEGASFSVTRGIVSQKNRAISESSPILGAVQTDTAINHGNSGGPLLNLQGEVVGVNTALQPDGSSSTGVAQGIGYAVGSDTVAAVYRELKADGRVTRGFLGVQGFESLRPAKARELGVPEEKGGILLPAGDIASVAAGEPADAAGIRAGDVITKIGDQEIRNEGDLALAMIKYAPGDAVEVELYRDGKAMTVTVTLGTPRTV